MPLWSVTVSRSSPNSQIDDIISKLQRAGDPADRAEITRQKNRLARLTMSAIRDDQHALCKQLAELRNQVRLNKLSVSAYLTPRPGTSDQRAAQFWPLQLLLYCAATHANMHDALQTLLNIRADRFRKAIATASGVVNGWNPVLLATRLAKAAAHLRWPVAGLPFDIDDKSRLICDGFDPLPLRRQQLLLLRILIEHVGEFVTHEQLKAAGVANPTDRLHDLKRKLGNRPVRIETGTRSMKLVA